MVLRILEFLFSRFRSWDQPTRIAFVVALGLLLITLVFLALSPTALRQSLLIGVIGLIISAQLIFMWGNRHMVTPFTRAQRLYLAEDFAGARQILEALDQTDRAGVNALTLLANTHRQLGDLDKSEEIVRKALALQPDDHFPLYSFGRTLLIRGLYVEAADAIQRALQAGSPEMVRADLGEAFYRAGQAEAAVRELKAACQVESEPFRTLMTAFLLNRLGAAEAPSADLVRRGIPYWQALARRFAHTPYGQALAADLSSMQSLLEAT